MTPESKCNRYEGHRCPNCEHGTAWVEGYESYFPNGATEMVQTIKVRMECGCQITEEQFFALIGGDRLVLNR